MELSKSTTWERELAKESKTKSGQSTDDVYESSWPFMEKMRFVEQVKKTARSTSFLKLSDPQSVIEGESEHEDEMQNDSLNSDFNRSLVEKSAKRERVNPTEQKQKLMAKCNDVLDRPKEAGDPFVLYVSQQLKNLDKRRKILAEKRINDMLFELQFEEFGAPAFCILLICSSFSQCTMFQFSLPQAMKIGFHNNNHSLEHMPRCCKNFKALYLVFLILCFCLKVLKIQFKNSTK